MSMYSGALCPHSGPLGLLRVFFLSLLPLCNLGSVGHSGPLSPLLPLYLLSLLFSMLLHHCLDSVGHSGPLGLWPPPLPSLLLPSPFPWFLFSPKSEPSRSFRPTRFLAASLLVFPLTLLPLSPLSTSSLPLGLSGSFRPTGSLATFSLFLVSVLLPLSP